MTSKILSLTLLICLITLSCVSTGISKEKFEQPILITSAGQSADVTLVNMLCKKLNLNAKAVNMAKSSDFGNIKTLIIVAGFSSKGLGAAGISREQELTRIKELIANAKEKKIRIVMMHIGGKPRRGNQSDDFNKIAAESSVHMIVVKQGNEDQFFTKIAEANKVSIDLVDKISESAQPLSALFK
jgi:hypothetical protein